MSVGRSTESATVLAVSDSLGTRNTTLPNPPGVASGDDTVTWALASSAGTRARPTAAIDAATIRRTRTRRHQRTSFTRGFRRNRSPRLEGCGAPTSECRQRGGPRLFLTSGVKATTGTITVGAGTWSARTGQTAGRRTNKPDRPNALRHPDQPASADTQQHGGDDGRHDVCGDHRPTTCRSPTFVMVVDMRGGVGGDRREDDVHHRLQQAIAATRATRSTDSRMPTSADIATTPAATATLLVEGAASAGMRWPLRRATQRGRRRQTPSPLASGPPSPSRPTRYDCLAGEGERAVRTRSRVGCRGRWAERPAGCSQSSWRPSAVRSRK